MRKNVKRTKKSRMMSAVAMLLVSAVSLSSATYAWFSMNTQVTATGMQVTAKSDNTFLLISSTNTTAATIQGEKAITTDLEVDETKLYPSAPAATEGEVAYLTTSGHTTAGGNITTAGALVKDTATADAFTNWYTANAIASDASTIKADTAKQLTAFDNYVVKKTVYLTVAKGANKAEKLTVTPTFSQKGAGTDITAARMLVTTDDGGFAILNSTSGTVDIKGTNTNLTDSTVRTVNIYIYYDGNDSTVYTNNAANLLGATMTVAFDVTPVAGA